MYEPFWDLRQAAQLLCSPLTRRCSNMLRWAAHWHRPGCTCAPTQPCRPCASPQPAAPLPLSACSLPLSKEGRGGGFSWLGLKGSPSSIQDCLTAFTADERLEVG